jgi:hypothetical protein
LLAPQVLFLATALLAFFFFFNLVGKFRSSRRVPVLPPLGGRFFFYHGFFGLRKKALIFFWRHFLPSRRFPPRQKCPFGPRAYVTPRLALRDEPGAWRWRKGQKSGSAVTLLFLEGRRLEHQGQALIGENLNGYFFSQ